jgi:hypothetical protein
MLKRLWRGWTNPVNADAYEELLRSTIFPGILARRIEGFRSIELLRRDHGAEVEFITLMAFDDREAVVRFAGPDWDVSVVPPTARAVLSRFDDKAAHYEERIPPVPLV